MKSQLFMSIAGMVGCCAGVGAAELYRNTMFPREGQSFLYCYEAGLAEGEVTFRLSDRSGQVIAESSAPVADGVAAWELTVPHNGLYRMTANELTEEFPVIAANRDLEIVYYTLMPQILLKEKAIRYVTVDTAADAETVDYSRKRGIKALKWNYGMNFTNRVLQPDGEFGHWGIPLNGQNAYALTEKLYGAALPEARANGFAGFGMDEFGGYYASELEEVTQGLLRGIRDWRREHPDDSVFLAWHGGPIGETTLGLYKEAVDFLIPESYVFQFVPEQLGYENIRKDLDSRLHLARSNDMLTSPYGARCKVLPGVDVTDGVDPAEYELFFRILREEYPEVRGIALYNEAKDPELYRRLDQLVFDYFIAPVITLQEDAVWYDTAKGECFAYVSNIGGMDATAVTLRLLVDGREIGRSTLPVVPAGFGRRHNRAKATVPWRFEAPGCRRLTVEILEAADATVLVPIRETVYFAK